MKRLLFAALALICSGLAAAAVINVEFEFTPFIGDVAKPQVDSVPGKARILVNGIPIGEQEVAKQSMPVLFDAREIAPAVWITGQSMRLGLRKGKNLLRIEFEPSDPKLAYQTSLKWSQVTDQVTQETRGNATTSTNQAGVGQERRKAQGKVVLEREFVADFAPEQPWHKYPAVTSLSDDDRQKIAALLKERAEAFAPKFERFYKILEAQPNVRVDDVKKLKCLDKAYAAGVRIAAPAAADLELATTGSAAVAVGRRGGDLFASDQKAFAKLKGNDTQMCVGISLSIAYPPRSVAIRTPDGGWQLTP
ncbi:MAG TPA: hypothetical protein PKL28_13020 [Rhodocyclaceae bacterium]|jgi:hypothetical protein|nr:hypothetical protein [Rhodocyclaceae bacterium]HMW76679.1 hypothetical protein [Rhodocyclaceae bacterium]HNE42774.1 hypothetical protein [Rhodocyclaceae bacterium]HNM22127.1 hypothetical protein [Rhodocyclaceae bacterium]HNM81971.1 hypothetical protein [Rhodocyclaceae bacterium]